MIRLRPWLAAAALIVACPSAGASQATAGADCERAEALLTSGRPDAALASAGACEQHARAAGADGLLGRALLVRGSVTLSRLQPLDSLVPLQEAALAAGRAGDRALLSRVHERLADARLKMGDWSAMIDHGQRALDGAPTNDIRISVLTSRGRAFVELRERQAAQRAFEDAIALARAGKDERSVALIEREQGLMYWRIDRDRQRALASYESALRYFRRANDGLGLIVVLNVSGNLFRAPGTYPEAERRYSEGLAVAKRMGVVYPHLLKNLGIVFRETHRRADAERLLLQAVEAADRQNVARTRWQARMELGTLYRTSDPARALRYFEECLEMLETQHNDVLLEDFSAGALTGDITIESNPYDLYIAELLRQKRHEQALLVAERARARAFLDTLSAAREALAARLPADYRSQEREILQRISARQARLRSAALAPGEQERMTAGIRQDEEGLAALRVRLSTDHPEIAHARYPRLASVESIRALLDGPDEAVLEYFLGAQSSTLWIVRRERLDVVSLPGRAAVEAAVAKYVAALSSPDSAYESAGQAAGTLLLGGARQSLAGIRRLVVVPHGILHYLPFEALIGAEGRFLVQDYSISYAPSASTLSFLRSRPSPARHGMVAIGHPRSSGGERTLPYAGQELNAVAAIYRGGARVLQQESATETALADVDLSRTAIVHFATHGLIDEDQPQRSGLALTLSPGSDGILQMREIYGLRLNAALVTLSACETALGKEITGEGMVGLSRAFFYAGAHAVMASLWNVNDASTADFMTRFYAALRGGRPIDEASREGKLAFIASGGRLRHPHYWAAFVVSGAARVPVRVTMLRDTLLGAAGVAVILVLATLAAAAGIRRVRVR